MPTISTPARSAQAALRTSPTATITSRSPAAFFAARSGIVSFLRTSDINHSPGNTRSSAILTADLSQCENLFHLEQQVNIALSCSPSQHLAELTQETPHAVINAIPPIGQFDTEAPLEFAAIQARIGGTCRPHRKLMT